MGNIYLLTREPITPVARPRDMARAPGTGRFRAGRGQSPRPTANVRRQCRRLPIPGNCCFSVAASALYTVVFDQLVAGDDAAWRVSGLAASTKGMANGPSNTTRMALTAVLLKARRLAMKRQAKADSDQIKAGKYVVIMNSGCALEGRKTMLTRKCGHCNG